jgi:hypothetical protein
MLERGIDFEELRTTGETSGIGWRSRIRPGTGKEMSHVRRCRCDVRPGSAVDKVCLIESP